MIFRKRYEMKEEHLVVNNENKPLSIKIHIYMGEEFKININDKVQVTHHLITELGLTPAYSRCRGKTRGSYQ
jgi:hypothetical protein